jgi:hypothetical protein
MIKSIQKYFSGIPGVFIDGLLYTCISVLAFLMTQFGSDEAAKYLSPQSLWWLTTALGSISIGLSSIKMFRSTSFAQHQEDKKKAGNSE